MKKCAETRERKEAQCHGVAIVVSLWITEHDSYTRGRSMFPDHETYKTDCGD